MQITARHWILASAVALLLHATLAAALLWLPPERGAVRSGVGGIEVALGPAGGAPGSASTDDRDLPEAEPAGVPDEVSDVIPEEEVEIVPDSVPVDTETADDVTEAIEAEPVPVLDVSESADVPVEPEEVATIQPVDLVETAPSEPPVEARPVVIPPRPSRKPSPPQQRAEAAPAVQPPTIERVSEQAARPVGSPAETRSDVAMPAGSEGKSGTKETRNAGSGKGGSAGGSPAAVTDYMAELLAWLQRHKEYPRRAKRRQQQGTALLYLVMDREGQVLEYRIQESSGHRLLDQEVTAMIERARPLPQMPDEMPGAQLELVVPVEFFLR